MYVDKNTTRECAEKVNSVTWLSAGKLMAWIKEVAPAGPIMTEAK